MAQPVVFFSLNDFTVTSGGTIRMYGILNAMAKNGNQVVLISNAQDVSKFHPDIQHIPIHNKFNAYSKRKFQLLLTWLPISVFNIYYRKLLRKLQPILKDFSQQNIIFFEYLDNSVGYWLDKNNLIKGYINDVHGIATEEFKFQLDNPLSLKEKFKLTWKYHTAKRLDRLVFPSAYKIIFPTRAMERFFTQRYPALVHKKHIILPNVIQDHLLSPKPSENPPLTIAQLQPILNHTFVYLFAGGFKRSCGILDLITAFEKVHRQKPATTLLLIGNGHLMEPAKRLVKKYKLEKVVHFLGNTAHSDLPHFQNLADVLVCPDEDYLFSHLIIHYKYLDALTANKVVINGNFKSVLELNMEESLSLGFTPSDVESLKNVMLDAFENYNHYLQKYQHTRDFILSNFTYQHQTKVLENVS